MQQPASKQDAEGRRRCDAAMGFGVVGLPSCCRGRHRRCMTSLSSSSSPGELFTTDNDHDDDDNDNKDDYNDNSDDRRHS